MTRQNLRRLTIFIFFLLAPIILNYTSPFLSLNGAFKGIVSGSLIVFMLLFVISIFFGRVFCSWMCPGGGIQEACFRFVSKKNTNKYNWIKFIIWGIWLGIIVFAIIKSGAIKLDFFYLTENKISIDKPSGFIIYYMMMTMVIVSNILLGRRAACHYMCWISPFMILGKKLGNKLNLQMLRIENNKNLCISCKQCNKACPMDLEVDKMAKDKFEHTECIFCGECVDTCPKDVLKFKAGK